MAFSIAISVYCSNTRCWNYKDLTDMGVLEQFMETSVCGNVYHMHYSDQQADLEVIWVVGMM
jgi:hypothetical protein